MKIEKKLARLQAVASKDKTKGRLCGVHFDESRKLAVATDGYALAVVAGEVPKEFVGKTLDLSGLKPTRSDHYELTETLIDAGGNGKAAIIDDKFPDGWRGLARAGDGPRIQFTIDANVLIRMAEALHGKAGAQERPLTLSVSAENKAVFVRGGSGYGIVMGFKNDDEGNVVNEMIELVGVK